MSSGEEYEHKPEAVKDIVELRHVCVEALHSLVEQLRNPPTRYLGLRDLPPDAKSDLVMLWGETLGSIVGEIADSKDVSDTDCTLEDLSHVVPLVDDDEIADMIREIGRYNVALIDAFTEGVDRNARFN